MKTVKKVAKRILKKIQEDIKRGIILERENKSYVDEFVATVQNLLGKNKFSEHKGDTVELTVFFDNENRLWSEDDHKIYFKFEQ